jgi:hypothetical protein
MSKHSKRFLSRFTRYLRKWHRKLGIAAAFFLIFLSLSGIALNHTQALSLGHQAITNAWLLNHYGIKAPQDIRFYDQGRVAVTNQLVWLNDIALLDAAEKVIAVANKTDFIIVVTQQQLYLYSQQGELIDQIGQASGVPENISALSVAGEQVIVKAESGLYQLSDDFFDWESITPEIQPQWLMAIDGSNQQISHAEILYQSQYLTVERIILDAHSGRLFGDIGVFFMDIVALLLILLSLSGLYIWLRDKQNKNKNKH